MIRSYPARTRWRSTGWRPGASDLHNSVWDPNSLSSFWFELVNGAYGDVYRAKALMNLPDGRAFFCNWMVSQQGSQFLPLEGWSHPMADPNARRSWWCRAKRSMASASRPPSTIA